MTKKTKKIKIVRGEKLLWLAILLMLVIIPATSVYSKALLSESNITVEKLKSKIENQENINESLSMKINELASLDKIEQVANDNGLDYNNNNIKVVAYND